MAKIAEQQHADCTTLARARRGDRKAFSRLMEPYRRELIAYCYRLTGTLSEAEDMAQEAFVRAFRALDGFEGRATPRAWLYRIAHNLCLNYVQRRPPIWEPLHEVEEGATAAPGNLEQAGQEREEVRLGFVALMQSLPPRQRAALVLRDVLGWSAEEAARILETTVPAVKNALARARQTLARQHPPGTDPADVADLAAADWEAQALVGQWVDAFEKGNTARMVELLTGGDVGAASAQSGYNRSGTRSEGTHGEKTPVRERRTRSKPDTQREERSDGE